MSVNVSVRLDDRLAERLRKIDVDAVTVASLRLQGAPDHNVFATGQAAGRAVLTENVADFTELAAAWATSAQHHAGLLIALSARLSRRAAGLRSLAGAIAVVRAESLDNRVTYLRPPTT